MFLTRIFTASYDKYGINKTANTALWQMKILGITWEGKENENQL